MYSYNGDNFFPVATCTELDLLYCSCIIGFVLYFFLPFFVRFHIKPILAGSFFLFSGSIQSFLHMYRGQRTTSSFPFFNIFFSLHNGGEEREKNLRKMLKCLVYLLKILLTESNGRENVDQINK